MLGDSFAFATQVDDDTLFSNQLATKLSARGVFAQVINSGRAAYSMADHACRAEVFERLFEPDWVIVQLTEADFAGDPFAPQHGHAGFRLQDGELTCVPPVIPPPPPSRNPVRQALHQARLAFTLPDALVGITRLRIEKDSQALPLFSAGQPQQPAAPAADLPDPPVEEELRLLRAAWGPRLTILYLPAFDPKATAEPTAFERRLRAASESSGIRFRTLREEFPAFAAGRRVPYGFANTRLNEGHWNAVGHGAAARILTREILELREHGLL